MVVGEDEDFVDIVILDYGSFKMNVKFEFSFVNGLEYEIKGSFIDYFLDDIELSI